MYNWHKGKKVKKTKLGLKPGEVKAILSEYYNGSDRGYEERKIVMTRFASGALSIFDYHNDGFTYLYPEQVEHLKSLLK